MSEVRLEGLIYADDILIISDTKYEDGKDIRYYTHDYVIVGSQSLSYFRMLCSE